MQSYSVYTAVKPSLYCLTRVDSGLMTRSLKSLLRVKPIETLIFTAIGSHSAHCTRMSTVGHNHCYRSEVDSYWFDWTHISLKTLRDKHSYVLWHKWLSIRKGLLSTGGSALLDWCETNIASDDQRALRHSMTTLAIRGTWNSFLINSSQRKKNKTELS